MNFYNRVMFILDQVLKNGISNYNNNNKNEYKKY